MVNQLKRFEIIILRPLQIIFLISAVVFLFKSMWWWLAGFVVCVFYLGIVGSKLHPLQSAFDLAQSPIEGPAARNESELLPPEVKQMLVSHACTKVGILVGIISGLVSWMFLDWHWYFAFLVGCFILVIVGALLKLQFGGRHTE